MKLMLLLVPSSLGLLLLFACEADLANPAVRSPNTEQPRSHNQTIEAFLSSFQAQWNSRDLKAISDSYDDGYSSSDGTNKAQGLAEIQDFWKTYPDAKMTQNLKVVKKAPDHFEAIVTRSVTGSTSNSLTTPTGKGSLQLSEELQISLAKTDSSWRIKKSRILKRSTRVTFGTATWLDARLTIPERIKAGESYSPTLEFEISPSTNVTFSIATQPCVYPMPNPPDLWRAADPPGIYGRVLRANTDGHNERVTATVGLSNSTKTSLLGVVYLTQHIEVEPLPKNEMPKMAGNHSAPPIVIFSNTASPTGKSVLPEALYQEAWKLLKDGYVDQTFNGQDWQSWGHRYDGKLSSMNDAHQAILKMVESLATRKLTYEDEHQSIQENPFQARIPMISTKGPKVPFLHIRLPVTKSTKNVEYLCLNTLSDDKKIIPEIAKDLQADDTDCVIIDLRDNPGGTLPNAILIANMFLQRGSTILSSVDADGYESFQLSEGNPICKQPVVVLIDRSTSSAAEILAAALAYNGRAKIIGEQSTGETTLRVANILQDGTRLEVPVAYWRAPKGHDLSGVGIVPDLRVSLTDSDYSSGKGPWWLTSKQLTMEHLADSQLCAAIEFLKTNCSR